jgi:hypothetical protein
MRRAWGLRQRCVWAAAALLGVIATVAAAVRLGGLAPAARELLGFKFAPPAASIAEAAATAAGNLRLAAAVLLAALVVRLRPGSRRPLDVVVAALAALNAGAVGLAVGAYGTRALAALAGHGPLELAAFALAGGAYLAGRVGELSTGAFATTAGIAAALIALAAVVETYAAIGGDP